MTGLRATDKASERDGAPVLLQRVTVLGIYSALTMVMTYPLSLRLATHLFSSTNDFWIYPWNNWWFKKALTEGHSLYTTSYLFFPQGATLYWHGFNWFGTLIWLPLQALVGSLPAHNVTILLTYVIGAYTAYLLAYEVTRSRPAAFVAGVVYAFYPHRYAHRGQLKLLSNQWIPLAAFYLVRLTRRGRLRDGLGLGTALALCGLCGWHQLFLAGVWGALWLLYTLAVGRQRWRWKTFRNLLLGGLVCLMLLAPLLIPMVRELVRTSGSHLAPSTDPREKRTDLLAFFLPPEAHPVVRIKAVADLYREQIGFGGPAATVGWISLLLAGWGCYRRRKKALPWCISAIVLAVLALGSSLQVNGHLLPIPLPYALVKPTLLGTFLRHPNRFNIALGLPVSVLVALGWNAIQTKSAFQRRQGLWSTLGLSLLILLEYCVLPVSTVPEPTSPFYRRLRAEEGTFAVADFPIDMGRDKYYLFTQTLHERPIVGGHVSRPPADAHAFVEAVPVLTAGREAPPEQGELIAVSRELEPLAGVGVRYVMVHKDRTSPARVGAWRRWFAFRPVYEDDLILAYRTEPTYGLDFGFVSGVGDGIGVVTATLSSSRLLAGDALGVDVVWGTNQSPQRDWTATLDLLSESGQRVPVTTFKPSAARPTSEWHRDELIHRSANARLDPFLESGAYRVLIGLDGSEREVIVGELEVEGTEDDLQKKEGVQPVGALFGERLQLLGYHLEQQPDAIGLKLHWQSLRKLEENLKFFVHLYEVETGELMAQKDVMPHQWTHPTSEREVGKVVSDDVLLPLVHVPAGRYRLAVGSYDPEDGKRLVVRHTAGREVRSNALMLEEITIR